VPIQRAIDPAQQIVNDAADPIDHAAQPELLGRRRPVAHSEARVGDDRANDRARIAVWPDVADRGQNGVSRAAMTRS
jgi:hypothetical protein